MISLGLGNATTVLVSHEIGQSNVATAHRIGWTAIVLNTLIMLVIGILCIRYAYIIAAGFTSYLPISTLFAGVMCLTAILLIPDTGQIVVDPALRAKGQNWFPTTVRFVAFVLGAPPLAFWLVEYQNYDISGVFMALIGASSVAFIVLIARWHSLR